MAIQTSSNEDGQKVSFVYPKKSNEIAITFKSHELNQHRFDFSGIFKKFTKIFSKKFNFFLQATTTTTESPDSISFVDENEKEYSTSTENQEVSSSTTEQYESSSAGYYYATPDTTSKISDNFYTVDTSESYETVQIVYLPPSRSPLSIYLQGEESPV